MRPLRTYRIGPCAIVQSVREQLLQLDLASLDGIFMKLPGVDRCHIGFICHSQNSIANRLCSFGRSVVPEFTRQALGTTIGAPGLGVDRRRRDEDDFGGLLGFMEKRENCF